MDDLSDNEVYEAFSEYEDDDFLDDFNNTNFQNKQIEKQNKIEMDKLQKEQEKENKIRQKEYEKEMKLIEKESKKKPKKEKEDDLFSDKPTEILGLQKRELLAKIQSYKSLFPELKSMKVKKNPSEKDLVEFIEEMDAVLNTSNIDKFLTDSILHSIKAIEPISERFYDITGLSQMLKANKEFHRLAKILYLKYNVFSAVPVEYQMIMLVSTSIYICKTKNKNKGALNDYLNEPIEITEN